MNRRILFVLRRCFTSASSNEKFASELKKTALYDMHEELGGSIVNFCGWKLPLYYKDLTIMASHLHTRSNASLFDVSHMLQFRLYGKDRIDFLEKLVVGDLKSLPNQQAKLTFFTNENGGTIDDAVATKQDNYLSVVSNAGCAEKMINHMQQNIDEQKQKGSDISMEILSNHSLLALQGPKAMEVLQTLLNKKSCNLQQMPFMTSVEIELEGIKCLLTRCGYTGEDGFEISVLSDKARELAEKLLTDEKVKMAGLAARNTLRLEAGMCLYGNDLNENITPVEASLAWTIGKRRRDQGGFKGSEIILEQLKFGTQKKRVGILLDEKSPAREEAMLYNLDGEEVGIVTSGAFSPSLQKPIAMGYVKLPFAKANTDLQVEVRGKKRNCHITKMPFVPTKYYKVP